MYPNILWKVGQSHYRPAHALMFPDVWGSQISRQSAHDGGKVVSLTHRPPLPPRKYSWYSFMLEAESTPVPQCGISRKLYRYLIIFTIYKCYWLSLCCVRIKLHGVTFKKLETFLVATVRTPELRNSFVCRFIFSLRRFPFTRLLKDSQNYFVKPGPQYFAYQVG